MTQKKHIINERDFLIQLVAMDAYYYCTRFQHDIVDTNIIKRNDRSVVVEIVLDTDINCVELYPEIRVVTDEEFFEEADPYPYYEVIPVGMTFDPTYVKNFLEEELGTYEPAH